MTPDFHVLSRIEIRKGAQKNKHNLILIGVDNKPQVVGRDLPVFEARQRAGKLAAQYRVQVVNVG